MNLAMIRKAAQMTQAEVARKLGVGQGVVSRLEHRDDMLLSTLYDYLMATGADGADIVVTVHGQRIELDLSQLRPLIEIPAPGTPGLAGSPGPSPAAANRPRRGFQSPPHGAAPGTARSEILAVARELMRQSADGTFTIAEILAEMRRAGTAYQESTIRTHITSRMCADSPDHHGTTYDDLRRIGGGRYRLRHPPQDES
jgi:transcriptional regulator with XRE-family HTH domain